MLLLSHQSQPVNASEIEKWLIMPGPVVSGHSNIETNCSSCHAPLTKQPQGELCAACHKEVRSDVARGTGFHGRLPELQRLDCATCHTDHEGRDFNIVIFDETTFDHVATDFQLHGAHVTVGCDSCHAAGSKYREATSTCVACHRSDDVHNGQLGEQCSSCHNDSTWRDAEFDHSKTRFPLEGAHAKATCVGCHKDDSFSQVGKTCVACHRADDVHKGENGTQCADCHSSMTWSKIKFDHFAITGFALIGGHKGQTCQACHQNVGFDGLKDSTCNSCHSRDDAHKGLFGTDCGSCHNIFDWKSVHFDHQAQSDFTLPAGHDRLECGACHVESLDLALPRDCGNCHVGDDVHKGQLGQRCESCHEPTHWTATLWFDHDITDFPLVGAHAGVACIECHSSPAFHDAEGSCVSCHESNDPHRRSLGNQCDVCHNPSDWRAWQFDHEAQTNFPLTGAHAKVLCESCHSDRSGRAIDIRSNCVSCHRRDDPHLGRFGNKCESCHTTSSFTQVEGM